jgi:hypothetical protein
MRLMARARQVCTINGSSIHSRLAGAWVGDDPSGSSDVSSWNAVAYPGNYRVADRYRLAISLSDSAQFRRLSYLLLKRAAR